MRRVAENGTPMGAELAELGRRYEAAVRKVARDGVRSGEFRSDLNPEMIAFAVLGAVNWTHRWFAPGRRMRGVEVGDAFGDVFLRGLEASPARGQAESRSRASSQRGR